MEKSKVAEKYSADDYERALHSVGYPTEMGDEALRLAAALSREPDEAMVWAVADECLSGVSTTRAVISAYRFALLGE